MVLVALLAMIMLPEEVITRTPDESPSGLFLLATHTCVCSGTFLNHIPTYRFSEFHGLKKPNSKVWLAETMVWPLSKKVWPGDKVSIAVEGRERQIRMKKIRGKTIMDDLTAIHTKLGKDDFHGRITTTLNPFCIRYPDC
ncbi:hypothetical protein RJ640_017556 [Escallonia rubra]|uniref:Uncharacterized protein n=1 Tax=Escallonia rubra TaxID=112253 RepID=A0AA88UMY2_9ASTE|nr:hypothetical protein RJ640_017556 [Escallonia rubra]